MPATLLLGVLALAAVLAYQAVDAARSNRERAESTLRDYARFAAWEFSQHARRNVQTAMTSSYMRAVWRMNVRRGTVQTLHPDVLAYTLAAARAQETNEWCDGCMDSIRFAFRVDMADRALHLAGDTIRLPADVPHLPPSITLRDFSQPLPSAEVQRWVRDTVVSYVTRLGNGGPVVATPYATTEEGGSRVEIVPTNDQYLTIAGDAGGEEHLLVLVAVRDFDGRTLSVYGFDTNSTTFLRPLFRKVLAEQTLLPPSLLHGLPTDSVLSVMVHDAEGHAIFRSPRGYDEHYAASDSLGDRFAQLRVWLALDPALADRLLVGGLPSSRLPLLAALFCLTAGLVAVALRQLRRQLELMRLRTDFISGVSHELRTPLAQIRWFAELLRMGRLRTQAERERSLHIIDQEARRLTYLVENVLNFSRADRQQSRVSPEPTLVAGELRDVIDTFGPLARARRMAIVTELDESVEARVDRAALRQVLLNLLDNACKYGPAGQTITVRLERRYEALRLSVSDQGPGIPEGERERIWEPFYRAERDLGSTITGSGIGLSVVHDLVHLHGGRIWVEEAAGGGARFVVELSGTDRRRADSVARTVILTEEPVS
ncbi:MAG TPA: HAMP domain-containing sensor histidine kinase [Gemmatimonadaceae bacterium]|nr:HAMP domain-containing sensor histidine kinase [Gemmatimonadaceae bacterium]